MLVRSIGQEMKSIKRHALGTAFVDFLGVLSALTALPSKNVGAFTHGDTIRITLN